MVFKFRHGCELASRLPRRELDNRAAELFDIGTTCIVFREGFSPKHSQVCHLLLPIGITFEPEDGEHLIDAVHHPGTVAIQDLVIGKVGGYDGREFPVIAVGDQILNGCVIRTIALASLRFRAELFPGDILKFDTAGLYGLAVDLAERFHQRLFFHSLYLSRKLGDKVIPCREYRILRKN